MEVVIIGRQRIKAYYGYFQLKHIPNMGGHPVLRWMMDNIFIRTDPAGNIKPDKEKSSEKIDGAVATIMALNRASRSAEGLADPYMTRRFISVLIVQEAMV